MPAVSSHLLEEPMSTPDGASPIRLVGDAPGRAPALAELAARTFPLACPKWLARKDIDAFIAHQLDIESFRAYLNDPECRVFIAGPADAPVGYALALHGIGHSDCPPGWKSERTAYLSKLYVDPARHGTGTAAALMDEVVRAARADGCAAVWLGVNEENERAKRFYRKFGFEPVARRSFRLGDRTFDDEVLGRQLR